MLNYEEFIKTDEYKSILMNSSINIHMIDVDRSVYIAAEGELYVTGDISVITKYQVNKTLVSITIDEHDAFDKYKTLSLLVDSSLVDKICQLNVPSKAKFRIIPTDRGLNDLGPNFTITEIVETSNTLKFPQWICPECGHNYMYEGKDDTCYICSESEHIVDLVAKDNFFD